MTHEYKNLRINNLQNSGLQISFQMQFVLDRVQHMAFTLLPKQNLPGGPDVLTGLSSAFIGTGLKPYHRLASAKLLLAPIPPIFFRWSRPQPWAAPFGVLVCLQT
jgi:hypothetical protein